MRSSLIYACLGLISISSLAGCGVIGKWRSDCGCSTCQCPVSRVIVRKETPTTEGQVKGPISGSSQPINGAKEQVVPKQLPQPDKVPAIPTLPMPTSMEATPREGSDQASFKIEALPPGVDEQVDTKPQKEVVPAQSEPVTRSEPHRAKSEFVESAGLEKVDHDPGAKEKSVAIRSVHIQYGHSEDFKSATGQVQMWRKTVRLRYAPVDQEDTYGGFVVLEGDAELARLRDGQHIRIRGVLIQPEDRNGSAHYRVQSFEILD